MLKRSHSLKRVLGFIGIFSAALFMFEPGIQAQRIAVASPILTAQEKETFIASPNLSPLYYVGDKIRTDANQKLTVMFINGNIIRLMPNTQLFIASFKEFNSIKREFQSEYILEKGAAAFAMTAENFRASISTPNVKISNLSNTVLTASISGEFTSIAVTIGQPIIENRFYQKQIYPGQSIADIGYTDNFTEVIQLAKFYIQTKTDTKFIEKDTSKQSNLGFSGQLITQETGENTYLSYPVYLYSNIFNGTLAVNNVLNERGFTYQDVQVNSILQYISHLQYVYFVYLPDVTAHLSTTGQPIFMEVMDTEKAELEKRLKAQKNNGG